MALQPGGSVLRDIGHLPIGGPLHAHGTQLLTGQQGGPG